MHKSHFSLLFVPIFPSLTPLPALANGFHRSLVKHFCWNILVFLPLQADVRYIIIQPRSSERCTRCLLNGADTLYMPSGCYNRDIAVRNICVGTSALSETSLRNRQFSLALWDGYSSIFRQRYWGRCISTPRALCFLFGA